MIRPNHPFSLARQGERNFCCSSVFTKYHYMKSAPIRSFFGPYFPAFGLNTRDTKFSPNAGKYGPEKLRTLTRFTLFLFSNWIILKGK